MRILFTGSVRGITDDRVAARLKAAAHDLGIAAATRRHEILICSDKAETVDRHVMEGARDVYATGAQGIGVVEVHRMMSQKPAFADWHEEHVRISPIWYHAEHDPRYKRLGARVGCINACDAVVAMGGDTGARLIGELAIHVNKPLIAVSTFGGAGQSLYKRMETSYLQRPEIRTRIDYLFAPWDAETAPGVLKIAELLGGTHSYFVSYSHQDLDAADHVESLLRRRRRVFIRDENELKPGDAIKKGLVTAISESDTFLVLWSEPASRSEWCRWERETALRVQAERGRPSRFVLLRLDDTEPPSEFAGRIHPAGHGRTQRAQAVYQLVDGE